MQSKNIAGKLEGAVPDPAEEHGPSTFAQASREQVAGLGGGRWHSHLGSSGSDSKTS